MGARKVHHQVRLVFFFRRKDLQKVSGRMTAVGVQENCAVGAGTGGRREVPAVILRGLRTWTGGLEDLKGEGWRLLSWGLGWRKGKRLV